MKFRPLGDRVVVRRVKEDQKTAGGIIIPDTVAGKAAGRRNHLRRPRRPRRQRQARRPEVKAGDFVLFGKWSGTEVKIDGEELLIMKESDIMGILEGRKAERRKPPNPSHSRSITTEFRRIQSWQPKT